MSRSKIFRIPAGSTLDNGEAGFLARTLIVNNPAGQWYEIPPYGYVAPYTLGAVVTLDGTQRINARPGAPSPNIANPATSSSDTQLTFVALDDVLPPSLGSSIADRPLRLRGVGYTSAGAGVDTQLSTISFPCLGVSLRADSANGGPIYVGGLGVSPAQGRAVGPGESVDFNITDLLNVYVETPLGTEAWSILVVWQLN